MMLIVLGLAISALLLFSWIRSTRKAREAWLQSLSLPGTWDLDNTDRPESFEFSGDVLQGAFLLKQGGKVTKGEWRIQGNTLVLTPEGASPNPTAYSLHRFQGGSIGIDGPGRSRQIFKKRPTNIIPLRRKT